MESTVYKASTPELTHANHAELLCEVTPSWWAHAVQVDPLRTARAIAAAVARAPVCRAIASPSGLVCALLLARGDTMESVQGSLSRLRRLVEDAPESATLAPVVCPGCVAGEDKLRAAVEVGVRLRDERDRARDELKLALLDLADEREERIARAEELDDLRKERDYLARCCERLRNELAARPRPEVGGAADTIAAELERRADRHRRALMSHPDVAAVDEPPSVAYERGAACALVDAAEAIRRMAAGEDWR